MNSCSQMTTSLLQIAFKVDLIFLIHGGVVGFNPFLKVLLRFLLSLELSVLFISSISVAQFSSQRGFNGSASENGKVYNNYYFFSEKGLLTNQFQNPAAFASEAFRSTLPRMAEKYNLLVWQQFNQQLPVPNEAYDRKKHFGTWIVDSRTGGCINTRGLVLIRDSKTQVGMLPGNTCTVATGQWTDPYSNKVINSSVDIQIDHMVPLKHAYIAGGWKWDAKLKCLYANYMGYKGHLVSSSGVENQLKSDSTPYSYLPPNSGYVCTYLAEWLKIKMIWNLALIPPEAQAITAAYKKYKCSSTMFEVSLVELNQQRKWIKDNYNLCDYNSAPTYPINTTSVH